MQKLAVIRAARGGRGELLFACAIGGVAWISRTGGDGLRTPSSLLASVQAAFVWLDLGPNPGRPSPCRLWPLRASPCFAHTAAKVAMRCTAWADSWARPDQRRRTRSRPRDSRLCCRLAPGQCRRTTSTRTPARHCWPTWRPLMPQGRVRPPPTGSRFRPNIRGWSAALARARRRGAEKRGGRRTGRGRWSLRRLPSKLRCGSDLACARPESDAGTSKGSGSTAGSRIGPRRHALAGHGCPPDRTGACVPAMAVRPSR